MLIIKRGSLITDPIQQYSIKTLAIYKRCTGDVLYSQTCFTTQPNKMLIEVWCLMSSKRGWNSSVILWSRKQACTVFSHILNLRYMDCKEMLSIERRGMLMNPHTWPFFFFFFKSFFCLPSSTAAYYSTTWSYRALSSLLTVNSFQPEPKNKQENTVHSQR